MTGHEIGTAVKNSSIMTTGSESIIYVGLPSKTISQPTTTLDRSTWRRNLYPVCDLKMLLFIHGNDPTKCVQFRAMVKLGTKPMPRRMGENGYG